MTVLLLGMALPDRVLSDSTLHIVISEGEFTDHLGLKGKIARVSPTACSFLGNDETPRWRCTAVPTSTRPTRHLLESLLLSRYSFMPMASR